MFAEKCWKYGRLTKDELIEENTELCTGYKNVNNNEYNCPECNFTLFHDRDNASEWLNS